MYKSDADSLHWSGSLATELGVEVGIGGLAHTLKFGAGKGLVAGATAGGLLWYANEAREFEEAEVRALDARLRYLKSCGKSSGG